MAAYGALVSVMQIIGQIQTHPNPPISLDQKQVESLTELITFLQDFLEGYSSHVGYTKEEDLWESRIVEAAYDAEDVIESHIVDQILARSRNDVEQISSVGFYQDLQNVVENMNLIKIEIKEKMVVQKQLHMIKSVSTASTAHNITMIGFDDVLYQMLDKITSGGHDRQIIPIVGMGGIGKTTLARNIYVSPLVQQYFDVCAWSTISQEYNAREILRQVLDQVDKEKDWKDLSEEELGEQLYKYLIGRRYFIVMDDMWNIEAWNGVRTFFPNNRNGSRIVVTTRLSNLASQFNYSNGLDMNFLDEATSWSLFSRTVFGNESCPLELEDIGKKIVKGCKGLPLSIVVIGGLLSKSERTEENWVFVEKSLSSIVNLDDNENCLQILFLSYNNLPIHLKPCFLFIGVYEEDHEISVSILIMFLVSEGILKPISGKSLEEVAEEYVEELVDRNLLIVETRNCHGKLKSCKFHDLLRDVCLREARKFKFLCVLEERNVPQGINSVRSIHSLLSEYPIPLLQSLESASLFRTFFGRCPETLSHKFRLLRLSVFQRYSNEEKSLDYYEKIFLGLVNLRVLDVDEYQHPIPRIPSTVSNLWNLQTLGLYVDNNYVFEIWKMPQLRHVITYRGTLDGAHCLPDTDAMVLENLQTLSEVSNLKFGERVLKRIPNIKTLKLYYGDTSREEDDYGLNKLCCLHKLASLRLRCSEQHTRMIGEVSFPHSLRKLTLVNTKLPWEDIKLKIGSLPLLQVLKLERKSFTGSKWETFEDQFSNLKFLLIESCDLEYWITDNTHFPRLEHLVLRYIKFLREIPSSIGYIPTLQSIKVKRCGDSVVDSAQRIKEEQEEFGNDGLQIYTCSYQDFLQKYRCRVNVTHVRETMTRPAIGNQ